VLIGTPLKYANHCIYLCTVDKKIISLSWLICAHKKPFPFKSTCGRINYSTRSRAEVVGEGGSCVRVEARAPASRRRRASLARRRRRGEAAARAGDPTP
jgi:hypothetical protein